MVLGWYIFFSHGIIENVLNVFIRAKRVSNCYMQQKKTDRLCVCGCSANLLVLVLGRQIVYGQNTVYICLSKYIVFENTQQYKDHVVRSIARSGVSPPGARSDGHHWCQAARTAATCTWSRGGAHCHGAALSASKFRRGAAMFVQ